MVGVLHVVLKKRELEKKKKKKEQFCHTGEEAC